MGEDAVTKNSLDTASGRRKKGMEETNTEKDRSERMRLGWAMPRSGSGLVMGAKLG